MGGRVTGSMTEGEEGSNDDGEDRVQEGRGLSREGRTEEESSIAMVVGGRRGLRGECGGMSFFILVESGLGMFQVPFWFPRVIFCGEPFPSD